MSENEVIMDPEHNVALILKAQKDIRDSVVTVLNALKKATGLYPASVSIDVLYAGTLSKPNQYVVGQVELGFRVKG